MKNILFILVILSPMLISFNYGIQQSQKVVKLEFYNQIDGRVIIQNIDKMLSDSQSNQIILADSLAPTDVYDPSSKDKSLFKRNPKFFTDTASFNPELKALWNNTIMVFGATADGIGVGTAFSIAKLDEHTALFLTAYHVVEKFCDIPNRPYSEQTTLEDNSFSCQSLYALNDIAIDTKSNQVANDGEHAWKSEIEEVLFFDKVSDVAAFRIRIPDDNKLTMAKVESNYEVDKPKFNDINDELRPLSKFDLYTFGYPSTYKKVDKVPVHDPGLIRKRWSRGQYLRTKTFESQSKLGLTHALKHGVYSLPGSSGGPMALPDGRVIGINFSMILNQYYRHRFGGCARLAKVTEKELYAIATVNFKQFLTLIPGDIR
ncbi:MAG: trypsin-like peptidase domain-containing protein [Bdellovibrio sp.]|nr:trypsin-like peptidase domain-containing protein [Bdellovibrio sp.]